MGNDSYLLIENEVVISKTSTIINTFIKKGVLVCIYDEDLGVGGAVNLCSDIFDLKKFKNKIIQLVEDLTDGARDLTSFSNPSLKAKIIYHNDITSNELEVVEKVLRLKNFKVLKKVVNENDSFEVYFYTSSGKLLMENSPQGNKKSSRPLKVLIVDDSKIICNILKKVFENNPKLEVIGCAANPFEAIKLIDKNKPDVVTLDINMPKMDGITYLEKYFDKYPLPYVLVSAINIEESNKVLKGLELGAVDYIQKPDLNDLKELSDMICEKVITAAKIPTERIKKHKINLIKNKISKPRKITHSTSSNPSLIAIGSSTGGVEALKDIFTRLPQSIPPTVVVQHIPPVFSKAFSKRLNDLCRFEVKEAEDGDLLEKNKVLIAPGAKQMKIQKKGMKYYISLTDDPPVNRHKPSVDYLFDSIVECNISNVTGVILTGMGDDGAKGLLKLRNNGAYTIAQDEESCVVFGMPKEAIRLNAADKIVSLEMIPLEIVNTIQKKNAV